jgi:hypothetical protein
VPRIRFLILAIGPLLLIGGAYALSFPPERPVQADFTARTAAAANHPPRIRPGTSSSLNDACQSTAADLRARLPSTCTAIVRPPFVIAGDLPAAELDRLHRESIQPVTEALWRSFFDRRPDQPVTIVALSNETTYRQCAWNLDGYEPIAYSGYTQRAQRRLVYNISTGSGTLTHELAHVLALFDFPDMPEWFDEGLAALHEEAVLSPDGLTLAGTANWRNRLLVDALAADELPRLATVIKTRSFRGEGENLNYAQVRCFCLYLQERGLLCHFYRKFRAVAENDPSGLTTLCELLGVDSPAEIDRDFRNWIANQSPRASR